LLAVLDSNPGASQAKLATTLGWFARDGKPYKMMVKRILDRLIKQKLVRQVRDSWEPTEAGKKTVK
jgi:hypothetical protein